MNDCFYGDTGFRFNSRMVYKDSFAEVVNDEDHKWSGLNKS
jgi:hypothetical protein